ncbi:MAG: FAD-dependent oxidoreductase [Planctomycetota bacterium]|nr:MAG: FAD-dependent oxidoreductase [Planctomycetota bacterium]
MALRASVPDEVDVVIVGAGITGASCFWHLASAGRGLRVACFEMHHKLHGSTARSAAAFRHQFAAEVHIHMSLASGRFYRSFPERFGGEPVLRENGYAFVYTGAEAFAQACARAERQRALGVPELEVWTGAAAVRERLPMVEHPALAGATFCRHDGFLLPDVITHTLFEHGLRVGGCLRQWAPVREIVRAGGRVWGVRVACEDGEREVRAPVVINAAGPWANAVSQLAGVQIPLTPVKRYLYFTTQIPGRQVRHFPLLVFDLEPYCRPEADALMCGWDRRPPKPPGWDRFPPPAVEAQALDSDSIEPGYGLGIEEYGYEVLAALAEYMPWLAEQAGLEHATAGYYEVTPDDKAIIDWDPRLPGLLHATGFSGHGVMHAPATGMMVRALVLDEPPPFDPAALALAPLLENRPRPDPETVII